MIFQSFKPLIGRRSLYLASKCCGRQPHQQQSEQLRQHKTQPEELIKRLLRVAIIGAPNAGKSTLLNQLVQQEISCVSAKVHTTRRNVLGVFTYNETQIEFFDSPGLITAHHVSKFQLDSSMLTDPQKATHNCDLIAVIIDANNIREQKALNKGTLELLRTHSDKESILILNKVDLVTEKRLLLDIGTRLTQGYIERRPTLSEEAIRKLSRKQVEELNLSAHLHPDQLVSLQQEERRKHQHVIDLDPQEGRSSRKRVVGMQTSSQIADSIGYKNFSQVFSISALHNDAVDDLRDYFISKALPVAEWPHGPDYLTNQDLEDLVHSVIRGKVLDLLEGAIPYVIDFKYLRCDYDKLGSLVVDLTLRCPERWHIYKVCGERGVNTFRITEDSRSALEKNLGCDVKLTIKVETKGKAR